MAFRDAHTTTIDEGQRQMLLLALAQLALDRPGFDFALSELAALFEPGIAAEQSLYGRLKFLNSDRIKPMSGFMRDPRLESFNTARKALPHVLFLTGDPDAPHTILDRNGEVVLGLCRRCGRAEIELTEPCEPKSVNNPPD